MTARIVALGIFLLMFLMIIWGKVERHIVTLVSGLLVLVLVFGIIMRDPSAVWETLNLHSMFQTGFWYGESSEVVHGINWSTIIFIAGMMVMVEGMGNAGVFRWMCLRIAKLVHYHNVPLLICFAAMAGFLSMFIDSITVILFLAAVTVELAKTLQFNPVPMIISEIFCANLGGSSTMCGDPPNIIIGTSLGYTFFDFLANTGLIAGICSVIAIVYFYFCFRKELTLSEAKRAKDIVFAEPSEAITDKKAFIASFAVFLIAVVLLISHGQTHMSVALIGVIVGVLMLIVSLAEDGLEKTKHLLKKIDYKTLMFFTGLFVAVGGLEATGTLDVIADFIGRISGGNPYMMVAIILWISAIASAFVDNIPFAATMVPVIQTMAATQGVNLDMLAWTLSIGADFGGNATPIGASANVVGTSVAAKEGHYISWGTYCKYVVPITLLVTLISMGFIFVRYL